MAVLMYLVLFLALTSYSSATYCICKDGISDTALQKTLDYACGAGADCSAILQNGACYNPNTVKDHCSYAVNSYFQKKNQTGGTCDFSGTATTSASPPSDIASTCTYPSSATSTSTTPTGTPSTSTTTPSTSTSTSTGSTTSPSVYSGISPTGITDTNSEATKIFQKPILIFSFTLLTSGVVLLWG